MSRPFDAFCAAAQARRAELFAAEGPITAVTAPGWVDLIGGVTDYGGSLALGWPTGNCTFVALQPDAEPFLRLVTGDHTEVVPCADLVDPDGWPIAYANLADRIRHATPHLAALLGIWTALMREEFVRFPGGVRVWMQVGSGPGAAASQVAALAQALVTAFHVKLAPRELALAAEVALRQTRNLAGALGPLVSLCAPTNHFLLVHQQPAWLWGDIHLPHGATLWALTVGDHEPQALSPALLDAAQAASTAVAAADGPAAPAHERRRQGYLANIDSPTFARRYRAAVSAAPASEAAATLAVDEHLRARTIAALLRAAASKPQRDDDLRLVGELLLNSHWAQHAAGFGNAHADALIDLIAAHGPEQGLFGARLPAPASGVTLLILGRSDANGLIQAITEQYAARVGLPVAVVRGSAPGAALGGARTLLP